MEMTRVQVVEDRRGSWVLIAPVWGLELTEVVNHEFKVDRVTFVAARKLPRIWKRLGFPVPISQLRAHRGGILDPFFGNGKTFATMRLTGVGHEQRIRFLDFVRDELALLALSQLEYSHRSGNASPLLADGRNAESFSDLIIDTGHLNWRLARKRVDQFGSLRLDQSWVKWQKTFFFFDLVNILTKRVRVTSSWLRDIRNATILAGQSQATIDVPQAFLWNMIAIELLLTIQGDKCVDMLPERAQAFIGWADSWRLENYASNIQKLYEKRNLLVHQGKRDAIAKSDLLLSDTLLFNILVNLLKHPTIFSSKAALLEFSEKVQAERILGIKSKVTPKTFVFVNTRHHTQDYEMI